MSCLPRPCYFWFAAMHTRMDLLLCPDTPRDLQCVMDEIKAEIKRIENLMNRFDPQSELSDINRHAFQAPVSVSPELYDVISDCIRYHASTAGAFDITVNSHNLLRNGISFIELDASKHTIRYHHPDVQIDLSGYAKGYALRSVKNILSNKGITNALVNFGNSSVMAMGNHPCGKGWDVGHLLFDECITTSENTSDHLHIINPSTGEFVTPAGKVSVITNDPAVGEVLSIACCVSKTFHSSSTNLKTICILPGRKIFSQFF